MTEQEQQRFRRLMGGMPYMGIDQLHTGRASREVTLESVADFMEALEAVLRDHVMSDQKETLERQALDHDLRGAAGLLKRLTS